MAKISLIGAGSWGTALSKIVSDNGHEVTVWSIVEDEIRMLEREHEHKDKLPGVKLPENIVYTTDLKTAVENQDVCIIAVPSPFIRSTAQKMKPYISKGQKIVSVAKGVEEHTLMTMSEIIEQEIPEADVAVLCGPSHAEEVGSGLPTTIVAGAHSRETAEYIQNVFMNEVFRVYISPDILGMELGAALKNVIALAAGVADGLGYGDNTKAALITRGIAEITRLGTAMGGKFETFYGLTGVGDLIVTCASMHSRNRRAGILIGQGKTMQEAMEEVKQVVEGVYSAKAAKETTDMIESSIKKVDGGTKIANQTADALGKIVENITKVANLVGDIANASNEQAAGIAQVNQGVLQVSDVVQMNSATSQESAAASEELSSQSELLKDQVIRFKLRRKVGDTYNHGNSEYLGPNNTRKYNNVDTNKTAKLSDHKENAPKSNIKIMLSDNEYGKY